MRVAFIKLDIMLYFCALQIDSGPYSYNVTNMTAILYLNNFQRNYFTECG